jgi:hypothetical protein
MAKEKEAERAQPAAKTDDPAATVVERNRRTRNDFELMERDEAGLVLTGTEVESLRKHCERRLHDLLTCETRWHVPFPCAGLCSRAGVLDRGASPRRPYDRNRQ